MRLGLVAYLAGGLTVLLGLCMLLPAAVALAYGEGDAEAHLLAAALCAGAGSAVVWLARGARAAELGHREALVAVAAFWLLTGPLGALPYYLYAQRPLQLFAERAALSAYPPDSARRARHGHCDGHGAGGPGAELCSYTNAVFESYSGITTTGATILDQGLWREATRRQRGELPHGLLFWRALTQFLGGMGIIVLSLAILPLLGVGGMQLYRAEVPGPTKERLAPKLRETARVLWLVYLGLTGLEAGLLRLGGMDWFNAVCHALTTISTGGFSTRAASISGFGSAYVEVVITIFMLVAGINFALHVLFVRRDWTVHLRSTETRVYLALVAGAAAIATLFLWLSQHEGWGLGTAFRQASFQVVSILTTTGYASTDFERWLGPAPAAAAVLIGLLFIGGCAGSTSGGPKVIRLWLIMRHGAREIYRLVHPRAVSQLHLDGRPVGHDVIDAVHGLWVLYLLCFAGLTLVLASQGIDLETALSASITSLGNIGPGWGAVGAMDSYLGLPDNVKWLLGLAMVVGRLEVYTVLVLFSRHLWAR